MENNKKGGFGRRTEGRREYGNNTGKRPRVSRAGTRGAERVFGENSERPRRSFGEDRSFGGERKSFGSDRPRRSFGENSERPRRSFGDNSERRSFGEGRSFGGERRSFGGERRGGGFRNSAKKSFTRRDFNYFRDENESGINKMISRRPQLDGEYSDNDMVMAPVKRSSQSILKEINPEYSLEGLMLKLKFQYFVHLMGRSNSLEKPDAGKD